MKNLCFLIIFSISIISCADKSIKESAGPQVVYYKSISPQCDEDKLSCKTSFKDRNCAQGVDSKSVGGCSTDITLCGKLDGCNDVTKQHKITKSSDKSCGCSSSQNGVAGLLTWKPINSAIAKNASATL